ncbi:hypothetical protein EJ04DRAFT_550692 [Polyplosphaeria fusca]|uniref:Uncharacterized protein n=1 Tax=Polyplosphaeria fusca TaxID=682080 RepID=A0A9P4R5U7_9PLEO|nr:hypothetical protein EJ04DRAFT_550692 [Polyplosphaeria fusca]
MCKLCDGPPGAKTASTLSGFEALLTPAVKRPYIRMKNGSVNIEPSKLPPTQRRSGLRPDNSTLRPSSALRKRDQVTRHASSHNPYIDAAPQAYPHLTRPYTLARVRKAQDKSSAVHTRSGAAPKRHQHDVRASAHAQSPARGSTEKRHQSTSTFGQGPFSLSLSPGPQASQIAACQLHCWVGLPVPCLHSRGNEEKAHTGTRMRVAQDSGDARSAPVPRMPICCEGLVRVVRMSIVLMSRDVSQWETGGAATTVLPVGEGDGCVSE